MNRLRGRRWVPGTALALGLAASCAQFPPEKQFTTPPYAEIRDGSSPPMTQPPKNLPVLKPGEKVVFFATASGELRAITCEQPLVIAVTMPENSVLLLAAGAQGNIRVETAGEGIAAAETRKGGLTLAAAEHMIRADERQGGIQTVQAHQSLGDSREEGGLLTAANQRTMTDTQQAARMDAKVGELRVPAPATPEALDLRPAQATAPGAGAVADSGELPILKGRADLAGPQTATGKSGQTMGESNVRQKLDEDFIAWLIDQGLIPDFVDADNHAILLDESFIVSLEEGQELSQLLEAGGELAVLLNRKYSEAFRQTTPAPAGGTYAGELKLEVSPKTVYFGHQMALVISVRNTGAAPIYDALVLNAVPEHSAFVKFAVAPSQARGYIPYYSEKNRLVCAKLYRPLKPGEQFRLVLLMQAAPWWASPTAGVAASHR